MCFFAQKTPDFGPKNRLRIWGVPPPPFTDKIRKVVFDTLPNTFFSLYKAAVLWYCGNTLYSKTQMVIGVLSGFTWQGLTSLYDKRHEGKDGSEYSNRGGQVAAFGASHPKKLK